MGGSVCAGVCVYVLCLQFFKDLHTRSHASTHDPRVLAYDLVRKSLWIFDTWMLVVSFGGLFNHACIEP